jgi:hypothetical protein
MTSAPSALSKLVAGIDHRNSQIKTRMPSNIRADDTADAPCFIAPFASAIAIITFGVSSALLALTLMMINQPQANP